MVKGMVSGGAERSLVEGGGLTGRWRAATRADPPVRTLPVAPLWCDLGRCSRTVVVIKLWRTSESAFAKSLLNYQIWCRERDYG